MKIIKEEVKKCAQRTGERLEIDTELLKRYLIHGVIDYWNLEREE